MSTPSLFLAVLSFPTLFSLPAPPRPSQAAPSSAGAGSHRMDEDIPPELAEPYEPMWEKMQRQVAALVPGASYQVVADATHDIHGDRPDIVADTIVEIVAAARDRQN